MTEIVVDGTYGTHMVDKGGLLCVDSLENFSEDQLEVVKYFKDVVNNDLFNYEYTDHYDLKTVDQINDAVQFTYDNCIKSYYETHDGQYILNHLNKTTSGKRASSCTVFFTKEDAEGVKRIMKLGKDLEKTLKPVDGWIIGFEQKLGGA